MSIERIEVGKHIAKIVEKDGDVMAGFLALLMGATPVNKAAPEARTLPSVIGFQEVGGTLLTKTVSGGKADGFTLEAIGFGFAVDGNGRPTAGTVTDLVIKNGNGDTVATMQMQVPFAATDWIAAAEAGNGKVNPVNDPDLFDLFIPTFVTVYGDAAANTIQGNKGDDTFYGKGGNDLFFMFKGNDNINGGKGRDTVDASLVSKAINANLIKGWVKYGTEQASLSGVENVTGSRKDDTITGN
ncbi:MAG: hypothetical protein KDJ19_14730, partial [Hyphomicrobiaceae bacterium]|nr:hypothetical protein [Hyphomicrobiaceae bacterium]